MSNFQKLIHGLGGLAIFGSVFSILIVSTSTLFPFIVGKYVFFRSMVSLAAVFYLILVLNGWRFKTDRFSFLKNPLFIAVSVFVLMFFLAGIFGVDFKNSFWSNFERGEGIFAMFHYFLFMIMSLLFFERDKDWENFFKASIIAGVLMSFYGFAQKLSLPGVINIGVGWYGRMQASLGNPAYVSAVALFFAFYAAYLLSQESKYWKKIFYIFSLVVFAAGFIFTETKGAFIGFGLAFFISLGYLLFKLPKGKLKNYAIAAAAFVILLAGFLFAFRDSEFIKKLPASRVLFISLSDQTAQTRLWTWGSAWRGFLERPIFGWGPENFSLAFDKYFDTRHFKGINISTETWFDRAHSVFFDYLSETGIFGVISFLGIFVLNFWAIFKIKFNNVFQKTFAMALPIAYLGQGLLLFDVLPIYINLFLFWGFLIHKSSHKSV
ncbi:MAG: O-antigen ligase family protein [Candidatus Brennerbacteria bacterium]|nr:O-antigen ligase family protein [Candidatus Brennerbacteria bacterium]